jgi:hypothetical protein
LVRFFPALVVAGCFVGCAAERAVAPAAAPPPAAPAPVAAAAAAPPSPEAAAPAASEPDPPKTGNGASVAPPAVAVETTTFAVADARLRGAGLATLADILSLRVAQTRRKMKLTEEEAARAALALIEELPEMPHARQLLEVMPKATIELVRSVRERGVPRDEAERMAEFLLQARTALAMDNPTPFDENCSHVVGREWQDIDYRDEGMTWQKQRAIYVPKGVTNFKEAANLRQFLRVESQAPYFRKLYQVKGSAP